MLIELLYFCYFSFNLSAHLGRILGRGTYDLYLKYCFAFGWRTHFYFSGYMPVAALHLFRPIIYWVKWFHKLTTHLPKPWAPSTSAQYGETNIFRCLTYFCEQQTFCTYFSFNVVIRKLHIEFLIPLARKYVKTEYCWPFIGHSLENLVKHESCQDSISKNGSRVLYRFPAIRFLHKGGRATSWPQSRHVGNKPVGWQYLLLWVWKQSGQRGHCYWGATFVKIPKHLPQPGKISNY